MCVCVCVGGGGGCVSLLCVCVCGGREVRVCVCPDKRVRASQLRDSECNPRVPPATKFSIRKTENEITKEAIISFCQKNIEKLINENIKTEMETVRFFTYHVLKLHSCNEKSENTYVSVFVFGNDY